MSEVKEPQVEWIVNDLCELGVKVGDQFHFLYKGRSYLGGSKWRRVGKREFGECCSPWYAIKERTGSEILPETYVGFHGESLDEWKDLPAQAEHD